jgi:hypothetical protein
MELAMGKIIPRYQVLQGEITQLRTENIHVHYEKNIEQQQRAAGAIAVLQAAVGQAGAVNSSQAATYEGDPVDGFVMQVSGKVVRGSFWKTTFKNGDQVEVIGRESGGEFEAVAVTKPTDRVIWMQPHCELGTYSRKRILLKYSSCFALFMLSCALSMAIFQDWPLWFAIVSFAVIAPIMLFVTVGMSWGSFMRFASEMNAVGEALGLPEPEKINLFRSTKLARQTGKPDLPMGVYYY